MTDNSSKSDLFDENKATGMMDLYSRQIGTYGVETMKNLAVLRVLIIGAKGVFTTVRRVLVLPLFRGWC